MSELADDTNQLHRQADRSRRRARPACQRGGEEGGRVLPRLHGRGGHRGQGRGPLKPELRRIAKITDKTRAARELGGTLRADVDLLNATNSYTDRLFGLWVAQDLTTRRATCPTCCRAAWAAGPRLLPVGEREMAALRKAYQRTSPRC